MIFVLIFISFINEIIDCNERAAAMRTHIVNPGQFPYLVSLQNNNFVHVCIGSIIHKNWIITTADSFCTHKQLIKSVLCQGEPKFNNNTEHMRYAIELIKRYPLIHDKHILYKNMQELHDISLIKTYQNIIFNKLFVRSIHIKDENEIVFNNDGSYKYNVGIITQIEYDIKSGLYYITSHAFEIMDITECVNSSSLNVLLSDSIFCTDVISKRVNYYYRGSPLVINNALYGLIPSTLQNYKRNFAVIKISFFLQWIQYVIQTVL